MDSEPITPRGDILIVDDKPANLQLLSSILKERGHTVRAVVSGAMGLIAARTVKPRSDPAGYSDARHGWLRGLPRAESRRERCAASR